VWQLTAAPPRAAAPTRPPWLPPFAICGRTGGWTTSGRCVDIPRGRAAAGRPTLLEDEVQPLPTLLLDTPDAGLPNRYLTRSTP